MTPRRSVSRLLGLAVALGLALPADAAYANDGAPTGDGDYTNVGAIIMEMTLDGARVQRFGGSGTLMSRDQFLTAHHIVDGINRIMSVLEDPVDVFVTFRADLNGTLPTVRGYGFPVNVPEEDLIPVQWASTVLLPGYRAAANPAFNDAAIFQLAEDAPSEITPVTLPPATLQPADLKADPVLEAAGYGTWYLWDTGQSRTAGGNPKVWAWQGDRRVADVVYQSLTPDFLATNANEESRLGGGLCIGDSGAPIFATNESGSRVQVALTVWGDMTCRTMTFNQRLDLPEVRAWIAEVKH